MKRRGFTIVELIVVISVIAILLAISVALYDKYEDRAYDAATKDTASAVKNALEDYYSKNNEYPSAYALRGDGLQNTTMPSEATYAAMATKLGVNVNILTNDTTNLIPVGYGGVNIGSSTAKDRIFYATRADNPDPLYGQASLASGCNYAVQSVSDPGITSYLLLFWSSEQSKWLVAKSDHGPTSADSGCAFTAL